jgi:8-oxo-dGTP pyrophosphatase MutT (NUDIX family)
VPVRSADVAASIAASATVLGDAASFLAFLAASGEAALRRDGGHEHFTSSSFVFSPALDRILLCFHRKGRFWVQFGGHLEPADDDIAEAALREAREESGLERVSLLSRHPIDLDRHELSSGFGWCTAHWDVGFAAVADAEAVPTASDESDDVAWFDVDALPDEVPHGFEARVRRAHDAARLLRR